MTNNEVLPCTAALTFTGSVSGSQTDCADFTSTCLGNKLESTCWQSLHVGKVCQTCLPETNVNVASIGFRDGESFMAKT